MVCVLKINVRLPGESSSALKYCREILLCTRLALTVLWVQEKNMKLSSPVEHL